MIYLVLTIRGRHVASTVTKVVYGHDVGGNPADDPLIKLNEHALNMTTATGSIGATSIDLLPFCVYGFLWLSIYILRDHLTSTTCPCVVPRFGTETKGA